MNGPKRPKHWKLDVFMLLMIFLMFMVGLEFSLALADRVSRLLRTGGMPGLAS